MALDSKSPRDHSLDIASRFSNAPMHVGYCSLHDNNAYDSKAEANPTLHRLCHFSDW